MSETPRLYVDVDLAEGADTALGEGPAHYLATVLRLRAGDRVRLFNGRDGEWAAEILEARKSSVRVALREQLRVQSAGSDLIVMFAPLKRARTDLVIEKATELGASQLWPVLTQRTDAETVRVDRFQRIAQEAAEQTERLDLPRIRDAQKLATALQGWDGRPLYYADELGDDGSKAWGGEAGRARPMLHVVRDAPPGPAAILTGPEGGFSQDERTFLRGLPFVRPVALGPRILRAETATIAALAIWQAAAGDWR